MAKEVVRNWIARVLAVGCAAQMIGVATLAQGAERQTLRGHVPAAVARLQALANLPGNTNLHLAIGLPLRNPAGLASFLQQLYDPASPNYHRYLTPEQFAAAYGPSDADYAAVRAFAEANGLTVTRAHPNRVLLDVSGLATNIEKAFGVVLRVYQHPTENRRFFAPDREPSVPAGLRILDISGLSDYGRPKPKIRFGKPTPVFNAGTGPFGNYMGYDFRNAYLPGYTLIGSGQAVGLLQFDGYLASDIQLYEAQAGLPDVPLENVLLDGFDGAPTGTGGEVEVSLDIEMSISMAPGLSKVIVYMAGPFGLQNDILNRMATDNAAKQLSCSWGWIGGPDATTEQIFLQMAAQGQSFFDASGDSDAFLPGQVDDPSYPGSPSSSPNITQVGGTTLTTGANGSWSSEQVWNWGLSDPLYYDGVGSSGGISSYYTIPSWQQGISMTANGGSTTFRNIPDVALTADNVFVIADNGTEYPGTGGTSCAAPLWAGFTALVNEVAAANNRPPVGFLNPALYTIGKGAGYNSDFHDIKTGNNTWSQSTNLFKAVTGYDLCTGWGTPNGINLITALGGPLPRSGFLTLSVSPASGSALISGSTQPIFATVNDVYSVTNATVTAVVTGATNLNLTLHDDGQAPDSKANDGIYSTQLQVPGTSGSLVVTLVANATNEVGATNVVYYDIVTPPPNDYFTNATKVPVSGAVYSANNRTATIETGEPHHDGDATAAGSLWWLWSSGTATNVLVDLSGSRVDNVVAVYTGSTLALLQSVAATNSSLGQHRPAYLTFNAQANTPYHIAVASANSSSLGSLRVRILPGGQIDTNLPAVVVTSPLSGVTVSRNSIVLAGTAVDPAPNSSGVNAVLVTPSAGVSYAASGTTNWTAPASLKAGLNTFVVKAVDEAGNYSPPVTVQVNYFVQNPANDFFAAAQVLTGTNGNLTATNANATKEVGEPNHAGNAGGKSVWWFWQAPADGVLTLSTAGSGFDTLLGLYVGDHVTNLTAVAGNDDAYPGAPGGYSQIIQGVRAGQTYHIAVDGFDGASGKVSLTYSFAPAVLYRLTVNNTAGGTVGVTVSNTVVPATTDVPANATAVLAATPLAFYQFDMWDGAAVSLNNPLTIMVTGDESLTAHFSPVAFTDGFESGDLTHIPWTTAGNKPWFVQTNVVAAGQFAARSGVITNNQSSSLVLTGSFRDGTGSFDYRVSSEANFDVLSFYVDGLLQQEWSGDTGWANYAFPLTAGTHTLQWSYVKDPTLSSLLDAAFIDDVNLPLVVATNSASLARLQLQRQTDGAFYATLQGQPNQQYVVQTSTNMVNWQNMSTNVATGGFLRIALPAGGAYQQMFYRAVAMP